MKYGLQQRDDGHDDANPTVDRIAAEQASDNLDSPMVFALWVLGLFGIGAAAFVLSALVAAH